MATKSITIDFYAGSRANDADPPKVSGVFAALAIKRNGRGAAIKLDGFQYQIREFIAAANGSNFHGAFAKFRLDDLPHAGDADGDEREIALAKDEQLIEKSYFQYFRNQELLVIQRNRPGGSSEKLAQYLTALDTETVEFDPVLQPDPMRRLMRGEVFAKSVEIRVARPTNPEMIPHNDWGRSVMSVLSGAGGKSIYIRVSGDGRSRRDQDKFLLTRVKRGVQELTQTAEVKLARVLTVQDGVEHPIDLIADRIFDTATVEMNGRYPNPRSVLAALGRARDNKREILREVLAPDGAALN